MVRNSLRSFRVFSLGGLLVLTLGLGGLASAHSAPDHAGLALQQATPTATIDPDKSVPLTFREAVTSPLDNDQVTYRNFTFKGTANQLVTISSNILTGNLSLKVYLYNQGGDEIGYADGSFVTAMTLTVKLPQDGNYKITVHKADPGAGDFAAGTFSVGVSDASAVSGSPVIAVTTSNTNPTAVATSSK